MRRLKIRITHLNRTEYPQDKGPHTDKGRGSDSQGKVNADELSDIRVLAFRTVDLGPALKPNAATCTRSAASTSRKSSMWEKSMWNLETWISRLTDLSRLSTNQHESIDCNGNQVAIFCIFKVNWNRQSPKHVSWKWIIYRPI